MSSDEGPVEEGTRDDHTMKILLATDIHLGYEQSTKRLQEADSFIAFEEILQIALKEDVDFILLGGDLFHDSKPTQKVILRCMELLRKYVLGARSIKVSMLNNPEIIFPHCAEKSVNFEDPNLNIAMPIFSIHGNHDNPSFETTGSMDVLGASGLINYFGKWPDVTSITIPPLMFRKGETYVSIYGLSYINDQRLSRLLADGQLKLMRAHGIPDPFKILVLHQNRSKHTANGFVPENKLPDCLDLVFWGHEHECRVHPELIENISVDPPERYYITQPGSSVATSLCQGEAQEKMIGLLKVNKGQFQLKPIKLETVRPFVMEDLHLRTVDFQSDLAKVHSDIVRDHVDDYIEHILLSKAKEQLTGNPNQPKLPLIRLRVFYTQKEDIFDLAVLSRKYAERVANPRDIIVFRKENVKGENKKNISHRDNDDDEDISECFRTTGDVDWTRNIQGEIRNCFARADSKYKLKGLSVAGLNEALRSFVATGNDDAFTNVVKHQSQKMVHYLKGFDVEDEADIIAQLEVYRNERMENEKNGDEETETKEYLAGEGGRDSSKKSAKSKVSAARDDSDIEISDDDDDDRIGARGWKEKEAKNNSAGKAERGRGKKSSTVSRSYSDVEMSDDDDDDDGDRMEARGRGKATRARGRGSRGAAKTARGSARGKGRATAAKGGLDGSIFTFRPKSNSTLRVSPPSSTNLFAFSSVRRKSPTKSRQGFDTDSD